MSKKRERKEITITEEQFAEAIAKVSVSEPIEELLNKMPVMFLVLAVIGTELQRELFGYKKEEEADE